MSKLLMAALAAVMFMDTPLHAAEWKAPPQDNTFPAVLIVIPVGKDAPVMFQEFNNLASCVAAMRAIETIGSLSWRTRCVAR